MTLRGRRVLLVLPQLPQDPASGAARSTRTIAEMLASAGAEVHAVATTASESAGHLDVSACLAGMGIDAVRHKPRDRKRPELEFEHRGIRYRLLDVGARGMLAWQKIVGGQFDLIFDDELRHLRPDAVLAYGGLDDDVRRYARARRQGARVVFSLRNFGYTDAPDFLRAMDGILTPSRFLTDFYRAATGIESTPLPVPMELADVVAAERDPIFFTMVNPSPEKGLMVMARLAEEIGIRRPDIPLMVIESRSSAGRLVQAGLSGGFDLRRHENIMVSPPLPQPKDLYLATRAVLAPSLWAEPAGRVAAEALLNGIPPLVSDRGGLRETCNGAGFCLPIPETITPACAVPVAAEIAAPWIDLIERLESDSEFYARESARALSSAAIYRPENLAPRYTSYFLGLLG